MGMKLEDAEHVLQHAGILFRTEELHALRGDDRSSRGWRVVRQTAQDDCLLLHICRV